VKLKYWFRNFWQGLVGRAELSYSKVNAYQLCPWKYKLIYVDGWRTPPTPQISLGLTIHRTIEAYHQRQSKLLEELLEIYDEKWVNEGFDHPQETVGFYERGRKMLVAFFNKMATRDARTVYFEQDFEFPLQRHKVRGIIDCIDQHPDGSYELIDYKTHAEVWSQEKVDSDLQLTIYSLGCWMALKIRPKRYSYYFLSHDRIISTTRTAEQEASALQLLKDVGQKIVRREFTADTRHCYYCDFRYKCHYAKLS